MSHDADGATYKAMEEGQSSAAKATTFPVATAAPAGAPPTATAYAGQPGAQASFVPTAVDMGGAASDGLNVVTVYYVATATRGDKMNFVRRVFGLLSVQLLVTFAIVLAFFIPGCPAASDLNGTSVVDVNCSDTSPRTVIQNSLWIIWVVLVAWVVVYIACLFAQLKCRESPGSYIVLGTFTLCTGAFLGVLSCYSSLVEVALAIMLTVLVSFSVIGLTCCSFSNGFVGPAPYVAVALFAVFWTSCLFVPFGFGVYWYAYYNVLWSGLGVLIFSLFLIYDTTIILNGSHRKIRFRPQDHCLAALSLYLDIVNLFICLLSGGRR